ncbi:hypothetical protein ACSSS7_005619 [Eimeria intestinalis]
MRLLFVVTIICFSEGLTLSQANTSMSLSGAHKIESKVVEFEDGGRGFGEGVDLLSGAGTMKDTSYSRLVQRDSQCQHGKCQEGEDLIPRLRRIAARVHRWQNERNTTYKNAKLVFLMRHAESLANREAKTLKGAMKYTWSYLRGTEWGKRDSPLSWRGILQSLDASAQLRFVLDLIREGEKEKGFEPFCIDAFISSPLRRALQTASISMNGIDKEYHCRPSGDQASNPELRSTWLVDPLVNEVVHDRSDEGQELFELQRSLYLLLEEQSLLPAVYDFEAVPAGEKWWLPYTASQLEALLADDKSQDSDVSTTSSDGPRDLDLADALPPPPAAEATEDVLIVGDAVAGPPSAAEKSVKEALLRLERRLHSSTQSSVRRVNEDDDDDKPTVVEELKIVQLRGKILLQMLCDAKDASTFFIVTHSYFIMGLIGLPKYKNAQFKPYALFCDGTRPRLEKIEVEDSKSHKLPSWLPLPKFLRGTRK